ncbi:aminoglycoside nucleotidyltransferase [Kutzneria viridogrisea]|uniref:Aminoglycoside-2''-adenylyltransferase n=2 Tax=Kutzneria TaxID=43356 RepID=W5WBC3_9PSEU|nr:amino acid transporter [Kutzneria albida]AHH97831.1 hypothetical protein KALB_4469 [Kutzneria albida DSM 43870]MBA8924582.1 lincosamide nucleotidyltransferase A/C/D/E [Kutzneria viridogrisea]
MDGSSVLRVLAVLQAADVEVWIGGGWGVDALVGRRTRAHRDLDLMHKAEQEPRVVAALRASGFVVTLDERPVRFVMADDAGVELDLHPLVFAEDGSAVQAADASGGRFEYPADCFVTGSIEQARVPCLSAAQQVYFHQGYEPAGRDLHDMALLRDEFGVATHF